MLPLNNILTFIHKVSLLNYWGRKRDLDFLLFGCFTCMPYADMHSITRYAPTFSTPSFPPRSYPLFVVSFVRSLVGSLARAMLILTLLCDCTLPTFTLQSLCPIPLLSFHIWDTMCRLNVAWYLCTQAQNQCFSLVFLCVKNSLQIMWLGVMYLSLYVCDIVW